MAAVPSRSTVVRVVLVVLLVYVSEMILGRVWGDGDAGGVGPAAGGSPVTPRLHAGTRPGRPLAVAHEHATKDPETGPIVLKPQGARVHFVTFQEGRRFVGRGHELARLAEATEWFATVRHVRGFAELNQSFVDTHAGFLQEHVDRGAGFRLWKPQVVLEALQSVPLGDWLVYADAGCLINGAGRAKLVALLQKGLHAPLDGVIPLAMGGRLERQWTKSDLLRRLNDDGDSGQRQAAIVIVRHTEAMIRMVRQWLALCIEEKYHYLDDSPSLGPEAHDFRKHMFEQGVFSVLTKHMGIGFVDDSSWTRDFHDPPADVSSFPFWNARVDHVGTRLAADALERVYALREHGHG